MASVRDVADSGTTCPVCDAPAQRGQLVCLECGSRITLAYRRPPSWKVPVAITALVLLLAGAGGALAYQAIGDDAEREVARTPANPKEVTPSEPVRDEKPDTKPAREDSEPKLGADDPVIRDDKATDKGSTGNENSLTKSGDLYTWPLSLRAFTVVLLSAEDRPSALRFARSVGGSSRVGVIRSMDFATLPKGFFVVFAGKYPSRERAARAAARLGQRFPGAFAQLVRE